MSDEISFRLAQDQVDSYLQQNVAQQLADVEGKLVSSQQLQGAVRAALAVSCLSL